jgi:type I restriction enzyme M protein
MIVERPLRLNFQASQERMDRIEDKEIKKILNKMGGTKVYKNRQDFISAVETIGKRQASPVSKPAMKAILKALSERDETADVCLDKDGKPEPDTELRDAENVPLADNIDDYFKREVLPHVPDAWMDRSKDKVGYEINFTKEFYKYTPLRNLEEIRKDIFELEQQTEGLLKEILE